MQPFPLVVYILHLCNLSPSSNLQAYRSNMTYPRYMFLTYGWYEYRWFATENPGDECTPPERERVLQHTLAVLRDEFHTNFSRIFTDTGIVSIFVSVPSHVTVCCIWYSSSVRFQLACFGSALKPHPI